MKYEKDTLAEYVYTLQSQGHYWFTRSQAIQAIGFSPNAFKNAAYRLTQKKVIKRVYGDFFIIIPVEYVLAGTLPASWFIDALMRHLGRQYYVSLLSAAAIHGAAHQQAMAFQVVTDQPLKAIKIGNISITFHYRKTIRSDFYTSVTTETGQMNVATPEMTLCDCLRYQKAAGHLQNIATLILELQEQINMDRLVQYIDAGCLELTHVQRLGHLIEALNISLDTKALYQWAQQQNMQYCSLVSGLPDTEACNQKWKVIINDTVEPDEL